MVFFFLFYCLHVLLLTFFLSLSYAGWFNPGGGATNSIVQSLQLRSGNTAILETIPTDRLVTHQHYRDFKGDANIAIPAWSYSHNASATNAVLGFVSFEQIDQPQLVVNLRVPTLGTAHATVGAAANADIGVGAGTAGADLVISVVAYTKNEVDQADMLLARPFN